jgi:GTPase-activating protein SAC7
VVPLDLYEKFRDPLRGATRQAVGDLEGPQFVDNFDELAAINKYQHLITELPPLNRQLLLYILDLLAVFAAKSDENRMNSQNLAAIFQPGMLSHPNHAMAPEEYRLNQCVIIFLIENQDHFLIGMQGTAADEKTKQEVEQGTPPVAPVVPIAQAPTPTKSPGVSRSASNASAGAESVRRDGKIRRNRSTSSRHSRQEAGGSTPGSPALTSTPTGGLNRSNTLPSKKSPALASARFPKEAPPSPSPRGQPPIEPLTQISDDVVSQPQQSPATSSIAPAAIGTTSLAPGSIHGAGRSQERLLEPPSEASTPMKERNLQSLFQRSPTSESDRRQPNKLKKKQRIPGSMNPSAQSSSASLTQSTAVSPSVEVTNPLEYSQQYMPLVDEQTPSTGQLSTGDTPSEPTPRASQIPSSNTLHPDSLKPKKSPPASIHSSFNESSDLDQVDELTATASVEHDKDKEKKRRWRLSRSKKDEWSAVPNPPVTSPHWTLGINNHADISSTSVGSSSNKPRKSFTGESEPTLAVAETHISNESAGKENRDESKGPIGWIRNKYREAKENVEQRRNKSPPADRHNLGGSTTLLPTRGKSLDIMREEVTPNPHTGTMPPQPKSPPPAPEQEAK